MAKDDSTVYIANLPWRTTEDDLVALFEEIAPVVDARIIQDRKTGRSCGYGFLELPSPECATRVVATMNGREFGGRLLVVSRANPRAPRS